MPLHHGFALVFCVAVVSSQSVEEIIKRVETKPFSDFACMQRCSTEQCDHLVTKPLIRNQNELQTCRSSVEKCNRCELSCGNQTTIRNTPLMNQLIKMREDEVDKDILGFARLIVDEFQRMGELTSDDIIKQNQAKICDGCDPEMALVLCVNDVKKNIWRQIMTGPEPEMNSTVYCRAMPCIQRLIESGDTARRCGLVKDKLEEKAIQMEECCKNQDEVMANSCNFDDDTLADDRYEKMVVRKWFDFLTLLGLKSPLMVYLDEWVYGKGAKEETDKEWKEEKDDDKKDEEMKPEDLAMLMMLLGNGDGQSNMMPLLMMMMSGKEPERPMKKDDQDAMDMMLPMLMMMKQGGDGKPGKKPNNMMVPLLMMGMMKDKKDGDEKDRNGGDMMEMMLPMMMMGGGDMNPMMLMHMMSKGKKGGKSDMMVKLMPLMMMSGGGKPNPIMMMMMMMGDKGEDMPPMMKMLHLMMMSNNGGGKDYNKPFPPMFGPSSMPFPGGRLGGRPMANEGYGGINGGYGGEGKKSSGRGGWGDWEEDEEELPNFPRQTLPPRPQPIGGSEEMLKFLADMFGKQMGGNGERRTPPFMSEGRRGWRE